MGRPKKKWGQHFLRDAAIVHRILDTVSFHPEVERVLEVGPGRGGLTKGLLEKFAERLRAVEVDPVLFNHLLNLFPDLKGRVYNEDFLNFDLNTHFKGPIGIIGNFPYNISSQIVFKMLEHKDLVLDMHGMFQKEMAERIVAEPGGKDYGIISVMAACYYDREYLFEIDRNAFDPPPKVKSAVIRLSRNNIDTLHCDERLFKRVVKTAFNQRRKKLRNSLAGLVAERSFFRHPVFDQRPEQLPVEGFVELTNLIAQHEG